MNRRTALCCIGFLVIAVFWLTGAARGEVDFYVRLAGARGTPQVSLEHATFAGAAVWTGNAGQAQNRIASDCVLYSLAPKARGRS